LLANPEVDYHDSILLFASVPQVRFRNITSSEATTASFRMLCNSLFTNLFFQNIQTGSGIRQAACSLVAGVKVVGGVKLTAHHPLVPNLKMIGAIPLLPLYASMTWAEATLLFLTAVMSFGAV
jgi:hypothetical protein